MEYRITLTVKKDRNGTLQTRSKITNLKGKNLDLNPRNVAHIPMTLLQAFCNFVKFDKFNLDLEEIKTDAIKIIEGELKAE